MSNFLPGSFISFLESLSFKPAKPQEQPIAIIRKAGVSQTSESERFVKQPILIFQREETQVKIAGFRQKILHRLREANHVATDSIADAILTCAVFAGISGEDRAVFLEDILERFRSADVSHFFVSPHIAITKPMRIDGYCVGPIDLPVLISRCNRAQSDYAQIYGKILEGHYCLQSPDFRHVVIDFLKPSLDRDLLAKEFWRELLLNYFELVSRQHFGFMWSHLDRMQVLSTPFGANIFDVQNMRDGINHFSQRVTIYLDFSKVKAGYVVPEGGLVILNQPGPDSEAYARFIAHRTNYHLADVGESELGRALYECAGFCQQAIRFLQAARANDAALYATICLEHLFSEKTSTSEAVCTRVAVLTHLRLAASYVESEKELRKLYDARSAFVHSGVPVTSTQAERLIGYARETIRSMLVLHLNPQNRSTGFLDKWVKNVDWIVAGFKANITYESSTLAESGIFKL